MSKENLLMFFKERIILEFRLFLAGFQKLLLDLKLYFSFAVVWSFAVGQTVEYSACSNKIKEDQGTQELIKNVKPVY